MASSSDDQNHKRRSRDSVDTDFRIIQLRIQNSKVPIHRLPPELLLSIFLLIRDSAGSGQSSYTAMLISWVSSYWRDLALSNPCLWNVFDAGRFPCTEIVQAFQARSANANLFVEIFSNHLDPNEDASLGILKELGRIQYIDLGGHYDFDVHTDLSLLDYHWSQPAPCLGHLQVTHVTFPRSLSHQTFPALHTLKLAYCTFHWNTFPFTNLTTLALLYSNMSDPITVARFLQMFPKAPPLECLELGDALISGGTPGLSCYDFPRLKVLNIREVEAEALKTFLEMVSIPPTADVRLMPDSGDGLVAQVITALHSCQGRASQKLSTFELEASDTNFSYELLTIPGPSKIQGTSIIVSLPGWAFDEAAAGQLFNHYDFSALTSLTLSSGDRVERLSTDIWGTKFSSLPQLLSLSVSGTYASSFLEHLAESAITKLLTPNTELEDLPKSQILEAVVYPSLKDLTLHFNEWVMTWPGGIVLFRFVMKMRWYVGCAVQRLIIEGLPLADEEIAGLKETVSYLDCRSVR